MADSKITRFEKELDNQLKEYGLDKVNTPLMLRKTLEEFLQKNGDTEVENNQLRAELFFTKVGYRTILKATRQKPVYGKEDTIKSLQDEIERSCQSVNNLGRVFVILDTSEIAYKSTMNVKKVLIDDWYSKYEPNVKLTLPDPKGKERLYAIADAFEEERLNNPILAKSLIQLTQANGGRLTFYHPVYKELLILNIVNRREVAYAYEEKDTRKVIQGMKGGAVSTTTIKDIKKYVNDFIFLTRDPKYWNEIYKIIVKNI